MPKKSKTPPPIDASQTTSEAFASILRHNHDYMLTWLESARDWADIEGVHQTRVAVRRMRSAISLFRDAIPKELTAHWAEELRWIGSQLGQARDLDVFISEGLVAVAPVQLPGEAELRALAESRRAQLYQEQVQPMLDSERFGRFRTELPDWIGTRPWEQAKLKKKRAKRLAASVTVYARHLLDKQERKVLAAGTHVDRTNHFEMHQLRIECKKLRYAAEFFLPLFSGMDEFIAHMKGLQDLLGVMNDVAVTRNLLEDLCGDEGKGDVPLYAGAVVGWRTCEYRQLLASFDDYWEEFVGAKHPWWKKGSTPS
ncbi:CHAD domain-containing protein [Thiorhodococcus minor]|uniref:CHAD domain-containing protein n=1 Tax=Thiorhodococcus minor TaxID=57489 RepID=A0A6M0K2U9_9GAMM|nr:CHAD domain-containing protein [Thiorhodococcus minor]